MKKHFDVAVVMPLEEEFEAAQSHFQFVADLSSGTQVRFSVTAPQSDLTILLVK